MSAVEIAAKGVIDAVAKKAIETATKAFESWKQCQHMWAAPENLEALQRRVAELEEKLGSKRPPDVCHEVAPLVRTVFPLR